MPTKSIKKKRRKKTMLITRVGHKRIYLLCTNLFWNMHHELGFGADKNWFSGLFTFYLIKLTVSTLERELVFVKYSKTMNKFTLLHFIFICVTI